MTIGDNIKRLREQHNMTQMDLANEISVSDKTISSWENGIRVPRMGAIERLSRIFNVSKSEILGETVRSAFMPVPATHLVPVLGRIACGTPILAEQNISHMMAVPDKITCNYILECHGDSMVDAGINDGDLVYVRSQPDVEDGEIAVVLIGDEATLKRVYHFDTFVQLVACNPKYAPMIVTARDESVRIEGKAVAYTHMI